MFQPDRPGPLAGLHVIDTGHGDLFVDRWPHPRAALARAGLDYQLAGEPAALSPATLAALDLSGTVDASPGFAALLHAAYPGLDQWDRIIQEFPSPRAIPAPESVSVRRLVAADAPAFDTLPEDLRWISAPWGSPEEAIASEYAFGAFDGDGRLGSVVLPFHIGDRYEDLGIVTMPWARKRGFGACCAARVAADVEARGRRATWSTTPDNTGSLAVAAKLGAVHVRDDVLYIVDWDGN